MMNESAIRNMVNKTIDREYEVVDSNLVNILDRDKENSDDAKEYSDKIGSLRSELLKLIPSENKALIDEFESYIMYRTAIDLRLCFKEGVRIGLTKLNYLSEAMEEIVFL